MLPATGIQCQYSVDLEGFMELTHVNAVNDDSHDESLVEHQPTRGTGHTSPLDFVDNIGHQKKTTNNHHSNKGLVTPAVVGIRLQ